MLVSAGYSLLLEGDVCEHYDASASSVGGGRNCLRPLPHSWICHDPQADQKVQEVEKTGICRSSKTDQYGTGKKSGIPHCDLKKIGDALHIRRFQAVYRHTGNGTETGGDLSGNET